jgi:hypothetical protein
MMLVFTLHPRNVVPRRHNEASGVVSVDSARAIFLTERDI